MLDDVNDCFLLAALTCYHKSIKENSLILTPGHDTTSQQQQSFQHGIKGTGVYGNRANIHSEANRFVGGFNDKTPMSEFNGRIVRKSYRDMKSEVPALVNSPRKKPKEEKPKKIKLGKIKEEEPEESKCC